MKGCTARETACVEPAKRMWWDLFNPTAAVNELLANWSWTGGSASICTPESLGELILSD